MEAKTFKQVLQTDVGSVFMNLDEFADTHTIDGTSMTVIVDDNEIIEREKKMKSNMDGVFTKQKLIYVKAEEFGVLPAVGRSLVFDGSRYIVQEAVDEQGIYSILMEASRTK